MSLAPWPTPNWPDGVPREISDFNQPIFTLLDKSAQEYPNQVFTIFNGGTRTYAQVKDTAERVANFLISQEVEKGDRVAIFLPNLPQYPAIFFGILKAGAVCVTCNPLYTPDELKHQLLDSGAKAVFCMDHPRFYPIMVEAVAGTDVETVVICNVKSYLPPLKGFIGSLLGKIPRAPHHKPGHLLFDQVIRSAGNQPPNVPIDPLEDLALIIYTGGTTGKPKGAALTHANFYFDSMALYEWVRVPHEPGGPPERMRPGGFHTYLGVLPWYHSFGMTICLLAACMAANRVVCIPDPRAGKPPFSDVLAAIQNYRCTAVVAVPTIYVAMMNHPQLDMYDLSSMQACGSGGAPMPVELAKQFEAKTGAIIFEGYGLSETSPLATLNPTSQEKRKFGSVGFPVSNTMVKIVDTETGLTELPPGEDGEIAISGPQVMKGYWNKPQANEEVFREIEGRRYFLSGDIGHIDEDGYIIITDRKKDMILVGGFNCYPREVEEVIFTHPKVAQAAVIGIPDPVSGEAVKAFIQLKPGLQATEQEILDFCREKLTGYKRPRTVEFRSELPMSVIGKVLRRVLRDEELKKMA